METFLRVLAVLFFLGAIIWMTYQLVWFLVEELGDLKKRREVKKVAQARHARLDAEHPGWQHRHPS